MQPTSPTPSCQERREEYLFGMMDGAQEQAFRAHTASCPDCQAALAQHEAVSKALLPPLAIPTVTHAEHDALLDLLFAPQAREENAAASEATSAQGATHKEGFLPRLERLVFGDAKPMRWLLPMVATAACVLIVHGLLQLPQLIEHKGSPKMTTHTQARKPKAPARTVPPKAHRASPSALARTRLRAPKQPRPRALAVKAVRPKLRHRVIAPTLRPKARLHQPRAVAKAPHAKIWSRDLRVLSATQPQRLSQVSFAGLAMRGKEQGRVRLGNLSTERPLASAFSVRSVSANSKTQAPAMEIRFVPSQHDFLALRSQPEAQKKKADSNAKVQDLDQITDRSPRPLAAQALALRAKAVSAAPAHSYLPRLHQYPPGAVILKLQ